MQSLFGEPDKESDKRKEGNNSFYTLCKSKEERKLKLYSLFSSGKEGLESGEDGNEAADLNPFPETEIDDMRAVRDAALARYIQVCPKGKHNRTDENR